MWLQRRNYPSITTSFSAGAVNKLITIGYAESVYIPQPQATRKPGGGDLRRANLEGRDLRRAMLVGADLRRANLDEAVLVHATVVGADLYSVGASRANSLGADLAWANMEFGNFYQASFRRAVVRGARLQLSQMFRVDAAGARQAPTSVT